MDTSTVSILHSLLLHKTGTLISTAWGGNWPWCRFLNLCKFLPLGSITQDLWLLWTWKGLFREIFLQRTHDLIQFIHHRPFRLRGHWFFGGLMMSIRFHRHTILSIFLGVHLRVKSTR